MPRLPINNNSKVPSAEEIAEITRLAQSVSQEPVRHMYYNILSAKLLAKFFIFAYVNNKLTCEMSINPAIQGDKVETFLRRLREGRNYAINTPALEAQWAAIVQEVYPTLNVPAPAFETFVYYARYIKISQKRVRGVEYVQLIPIPKGEDAELASFVSFGDEVQTEQPRSLIQQVLEEWMGQEKVSGSGYLFSVPNDQKVPITEHELSWVKATFDPLPHYTIVTCHSKEVHITYVEL